MVAACVAQPACKAVTVWGMTDKYTWLDSRDDICGDAARPLLFDGDYVAKPAYEGFLDALLGKRYYPSRDRLILARCASSGSPLLEARRRSDGGRDRGRMRGGRGRDEDGDEDKDNHEDG